MVKYFTSRSPGWYVPISLCAVPPRSVEQHTVVPAEGLTLNRGVWRDQCCWFWCSTMWTCLCLRTASLVIADFPQDSLELWGERCQGTTLTPVTPWPEGISQGNTAAPGRHLTGVKKTFIQVLPAFPWQSVVGPLLFWHDNYCPFWSGRIFSFWHLRLSPKAFLDVQWGRFQNSLRKHLFVGSLLHVKATG